MNTPEIECGDLEKAERLRAFFNGEVSSHTDSDLSIGAKHDQVRARIESEVEASLDDLMTLCDEDSDEDDNLASLDDLEDVTRIEADDTDTVEPVAVEPVAPAKVAPIDEDDEEPDFERIDHAPAPTPFDKARQRIEDAEILLAVAQPGSAEHHEALADLANANRLFKLEQGRATDDGWRKRRAIDEHRAGAGKVEYNAGRRKKRPKPNTMTPKDVLDAMTPEQRARHKLDQTAKRVWVHKKRKAGWTEERIEAELPGWWSRLLAKRACA